MAPPRVVNLAETEVLHTSHKGLEMAGSACLVSCLSIFLVDGIRLIAFWFFTLRSVNESDFCAKSFREACCCSNHHCRSFRQTEQCTPSTNRPYNFFCYSLSHTSTSLAVVVEQSSLASSFFAWSFEYWHRQLQRCQSLSIF